MLLMEAEDSRLDCSLEFDGCIISCPDITHMLEILVDMGGVEEEMDVVSFQGRIPMESSDFVRCRLGRLLGRRMWEIKGHHDGGVVKLTPTRLDREGGYVNNGKIGVR